MFFFFGGGGGGGGGEKIYNFFIALSTPRSLQRASLHSSSNFIRTNGGRNNYVMTISSTKRFGLVQIGCTVWHKT